MDYARKYVLLPQTGAFLQKPTAEESLLDSEMRSILQKRIRDSEKWLMYSQVLQKYVDLQEIRNHPLKLDIFETATETEKQQQQQQQQQTISSTPSQNDIQIREQKFESIVNAMPQSYRDTTKNFLEYLQKHNVDWNDQNQVFINGNVIANSNIYDLVRDFVSSRKKLSAPGAREFASHLQRMKAPLLFIGNKEYNMLQSPTPRTHQIGETPKILRSRFSQSTSEIIRRSPLFNQDGSGNRWLRY